MTTNHKPQPLPRSIGGKKINMHPLLAVVAEIGQKELADRLGLTKQTMSDMVRRATEDRDYNVAPHHVLVIAEAAGMPPYVLRPDLYRQEWVIPEKPSKAKKPKAAEPAEATEATEAAEPKAKAKKKKPKAAKAADPVKPAEAAEAAEA